jgi:hypothetical protein
LLGNRRIYGGFPSAVASLIFAFPDLLENGSWPGPLVQSPELSFSAVLPINFYSTTLVLGFFLPVNLSVALLNFPFFPPHAPQLADAEMDYVVEDVMIGSLTPVAASAGYRPACHLTTIYFRGHQR